MTQQTGVPAGWYPDPAAAGSTRWWDGQAWTNHTAPAAVVAQPVIPEYAGQPAYGAHSAAAAYPPAYAGHAMTPEPGIGAHPNDAVHWLVPTGRSGLAITAGYLGIVSLFCFIAAPFALATGIVALRRLNGQSEQHGKGRAIFAIVAGGFGLLVGVVYVYYGITG